LRDVWREAQLISKSIYDIFIVGSLRCLLKISLCVKVENVKHSDYTGQLTPSITLDVQFQVALHLNEGCKAANAASQLKTCSLLSSFLLDAFDENVCEKS